MLSLFSFLPAIPIKKGSIEEGCTEESKEAKCIHLTKSSTRKSNKKQKQNLTPVTLTTPSVNPVAVSPSTIIQVTPIPITASKENGCTEEIKGTTSIPRTTTSKPKTNKPKKRKARNKAVTVTTSTLTTPAVSPVTQICSSPIPITASKEQRNTESKGATSTISTQKSSNKKTKKQKTKTTAVTPTATITQQTTTSTVTTPSISPVTVIPPSPNSGTELIEEECTNESNGDNFIIVTKKNKKTLRPDSATPSINSVLVRPSINPGTATKSMNNPATTTSTVTATSINLVPVISSSPRTVIFRPTKKGDELNKANPKLLMKELMVLGEYTGIRDIREGGLAVDFPPSTDLTTLLSKTTLVGVPITCRLPESSTCAAVLSGVHPLLTPEDILEELQTFPAKELLQIKRLGKDSWKVKLTFEGADIPERVCLFGRSHLFQVYKEKRLQCLKCGRFGHTIEACRGGLRREAVHKTNVCSTGTKPCCSSCGRTHSTNAAACPMRVVQMKKCEERATYSVPHRVASEAITYADALRATKPIKPVCVTPSNIPPTSIPVTTTEECNGEYYIDFTKKKKKKKIRSVSVTPSFNPIPATTSTTIPVTTTATVTPSSISTVTVNSSAPIPGIESIEQECTEGSKGTTCIPLTMNSTPLMSVTVTPSSTIPVTATEECDGGYYIDFTKKKKKKKTRPVSATPSINPLPARPLINAVTSTT